MKTCSSGLLLLLLCTALQAQAWDTNRYHLGLADEPEWEEFVGRTPHGPGLELRFVSETNLHECCLLIWQDNVKQDWPVLINQKRIGKLFTMEAPLINALALPPGTLRSGTNLLTVLSPKQKDDIEVGEFTIVRSSMTQALAQAFVEITALEEPAGRPVPCRVTITDTNGSLAALSVEASPHLAARPGVVYTSTGKARIGLHAGRYQITVGRGFEYSLSKASCALVEGEVRKMQLSIRREVDTSGWVSSDTHAHTFTYSRHGDATTEERAVTLAGEGIELPIATDHNVLTDYTQAAETTGTRAYFTPVIGDEVTTPIGHFNIFPVVAGSRVPDFRLQTWPALLQSMRQTPGVQVIILNHPHNVHTGFEPFASTNFQALSGRARRVLDFRFDAMELVNSSALQSDPFGIFHDWFAILNAGHRVVGVGSSDGHDVSRYIIGQGRTYIQAQSEIQAESTWQRQPSTFAPDGRW